MCTVVILRRPGHAWPLLLAGNRDEMMDRPWDAPARHWPDRPDVVAGRDRLAGGTWLGLNDSGVVAILLNRRGTLGPANDARSRGELPLEALDHATAADAADALRHLDPSAYRTFNLVIADAQNAYWLASRRGEMGVPDSAPIVVTELPPGITMLTAGDADDTTSPRVRAYRPRFIAAPAPDPDKDDWFAWEALLADTRHESDAGPEGAMRVATDWGFGTVCASAVALPSPERRDARPVWRFAAGAPDAVPFAPVALS